jgi:acyl carrier protein
MILLASRPKNPGDRSAKGINGGRGKNVKVDPPRPAKEKKLTYGDVEKGVRSAVIKMKRNHEIKKIKNNHQLSDLGFDSLSIIELLVMLEEKFDIEIPDQVEDRILAGTVQDAINDMVALLDVKK